MAEPVDTAAVPRTSTATNPEPQPEASDGIALTPEEERQCDRATD